jgi:hypothetical protein
LESADFPLIWLATLRNEEPERVFVGTRGSLLTVILLHAAWNTSEVFLPLFPAATGDSRPW